MTLNNSPTSYREAVTVRGPGLSRFAATLGRRRLKIPTPTGVAAKSLKRHNAFGVGGFLNYHLA